MEEAIKIITSRWEELHKIQQGGFSHCSYMKTPAVWIGSSDTADSYEVDEEWIGISPQGNIVWAYASDCSCWGGEYDEDTKPTIKEFTLNHSHTPEEWIEAIIKFSQTFEIQNL